MANTEQSGQLSEQQSELTMLRESALDFTRKWTDHKRLRAMRETAPGYDKALVGEMAGMGWNGILIPESHGGLGLGLSAMAVVLEELGRGLIADPLVTTTVLGGRALEHSGNDALKAKLLPKIADGSLQVSLAWQENAGQLGAAAPATRAVAQGGDVSLTGRKRFVAGAGGANGFLVSAAAQPSGAVGLYWVPRDAKGLEVSYEWRADATPIGVLALNDVVVPADAVAAAPGTAEAVIERAMDEATVMSCAEMLGVMRAALDMTVEYMRNRVQFDKPIGSFQALQHRAVDLYIQQELAAAVVAEVVAALEAGPSAAERIKLVARCKSRCNEAVLRITRDAIQLHGGIGTTDDYDIGLYLKRALTLAAWLGSSPVQRQRFAKLEMKEWLLSAA